jgi:hypothetical protein
MYIASSDNSNSLSYLQFLDLIVLLSMYINFFKLWEAKPKLQTTWCSINELLRDNRKDLIMKAFSVHSQ